MIIKINYGIFKGVIALSYAKRQEISSHGLRLIAKGYPILYKRIDGAEEWNRSTPGRKVNNPSRGRQRARIPSGSIFFCVVNLVGN
jgi:hypothetical protein